jgi:hypothetical protein
MFTRTTDAASVLFLATAPVQLAVLAVRPDVAPFVYLAIGGWSVHIGSGIGRRMFEAQDPWEYGVSAAWIVNTQPVRIVAGMVLYATLTVGVAAGLGAVLQPSVPGLAAIAAVLTGPLSSALAARRWYLSPTFAVVELGGRLLGDESFFPPDLRGRFLTEQDLRVLFTRHPGSQ